MGKQGVVWAASIAVAALGLAACGSSPSTSSGASTTAIAPAAALATGTYAPAGTSSAPHYAVTITSANGTQFKGAMRFVYQDGTTSHVLDFSGNVSGESAVVTPKNVTASSTGTQTVSSVPTTIRIGIGADALTFEGCQTYLAQALSPAACTFTQSR